jgi:hypothetical protein
MSAQSFWTADAALASAPRLSSMGSGSPGGRVKVPWTGQDGGTSFTLGVRDRADEEGGPVSGARQGYRRGIESSLVKSRTSAGFGW